MRAAVRERIVRYRRYVSVTYSAEDDARLCW